ncbi:MAG TPA: polysaccharide biosynthesis protein [Gemmataceae bacterium]|nr:polysaccharide biosynthesis protein [Gemmataceae bacterium]
MARDPILFRVDATPQAGWERLTRCLTYAAAIQRRRRQAYFLTQLDPASLALQVKRGGNEWLEPDGPAGTSEDAGEVVREIRRIRPAAVVVDVPDVNESYLAELAATGTLVVTLDNLAAVRFPSHLVINPLLSPARDAYEFLPGTQLLLGPRYALVRPEVRRIRPVRAQEPLPPFRALLALGDDDPHQQTSVLLRQLLAMSRLERIDVAVRAHHPDLPQLQELAATQPERLEVVTEMPEITSRLARCHFAITAGSGWSLELACIGLPQLVIVQAEGYWPTAQRLEEEGAAVCLGWYENVTPSTIRQAVQNLLSDPLERQTLARCGRKLIDGRGPDRLVTALEVMLHSPQLEELRQAA